MKDLSKSNSSLTIIFNNLINSLKKQAVSGALEKPLLLAFKSNKRLYIFFGKSCLKTNLNQTFQYCHLVSVKIDRFCQQLPF